MSGRKMDRHRALAVLYYNYPLITVETDPEWTEEMVESMTDDPKADKREVCEERGMEYPPEWWMQAYFDEGVIYPPCYVSPLHEPRRYDLRGKEME